MARRDQVLSLFGASPAQVLQRIREENQALMAQQRSPQATVGFGIGSELMRAFGPEDPRVAEARRRQAIGQGIEAPMGTADYFTEVAKRFKAQGMMDSALAATQQAQVLRQAELQKAQAQRAQSAAVEYVSKVDPALGALVAGNPDAAAKAIETVNKRLETKVVDKSLLALNPETNQYEAVYTAPPQPGDSFKILTSEEVQERGLPANVPFQINTKTNKVSALANIPRQSDATAPTGYRYVYGTNERGEQFIERAEPIPGTPQYEQQKAEKARVSKGLAATGAIYNTVTDNINDALLLVRDPEAWVGGKTGALVELAGTATGGVLSAGSQQQTLNFKYDTIKANIAFNKLQQIREASKTGGALGNVSNFEVGRLEAVLGKLDSTASKAIQEEVLLEVQNQFEKTARAIANDYTNQELAGFGMTQDEVDMYASFRTHTKNPDGTLTPLPTSEQAQPFSLDNLPEDIRGVWDFMPDEDKRLFGWTPQ